MCRYYTDLKSCHCSSPKQREGWGIGREGFLEDCRTFSAILLANDFIVTQPHSNFFSICKEIWISLKNSNVYHPSFTSQMIIISMSLDWRANENKEKLLITRYICHAMIYGAGYYWILLMLVITTWCRKY